MSKTLVLRTTTHIHQSGDYSLCGEPVEDMMMKGENKKIKGVKQDNVGCLRCLLLQVEQWDDLNGKCGELNKYSDEDFDSLLACLDLVSNSPTLQGLVAPSSKDVEVVTPPAKKTAAKKKTVKEPPL
jgi:hypothetical protein